MSQVIGLDIGTSHIKAVELNKVKDEFILTRYAVIPQKKIFNNTLFWDMEDIDKLAKLLKNFLSDYKFTADKIVPVIPESLTFSKVLVMPVLKEKELQEAINIEAKQQVPYPLDDLYLKYDVLTPPTKSHSDRKKMKLLLVAIRKRNIDRYLKIIEKSNRIPVGIEPSSISTVRSLINGKAFDLPTLIINLGYKNMEFYYVVDRKFVYARTVSFGISSIIKAIMVNLNISQTQATEYLYTYGLKQNELNGKLFEVIKPAVGVLVNELEKSERFITSRDIFRSNEGINQIRRIVFTGGGALIPELLAIMPQFTNAEISLANTWVSINIKKVVNVSALDRFGPLFSSAVGAAMK